MNVTCPKCAHVHTVNMQTGPREGSATAAIYAWALANPTATRRDALDWADEVDLRTADGRPVSPLTVLTQYRAARKAQAPK